MSGLGIGGDLIENIGGGADGVAARIAAGNAVLRRYDGTGETDHVPAVSTTDPMAAMPFAIDFHEKLASGACERTQVGVLVAQLCGVDVDRGDEALR